MSFKESLDFALQVSGVAGASSELKRFESEAGKAADGAGSRWEGMGSKMQHVGAGLTLGVTVPLIAGFGMATKAALEDAEAQEKLAGALERNTGATKEQVTADESWISSQLKAKGFTDDELRPAIERATRSTKDLKEGQDLVSVAMDASVQTGKPLEAIVEALAKAHDGNTTALKKLGIETKDTEGKALSYQQVLQNLTDLTGGAASEAANTQAGKLKIARAELGESAETIGATLLPVIGKLAGGITTVTEAFDGLSPGMQNVIVYGGLAAAALGPLVTVTGTLIKNAETLGTGVGKLAGALGLGLNPATVGAAGIAVLAVQSWKQHRDEIEANRKRVDELTKAEQDLGVALEGAVPATVRQEAINRDLGEAYQKIGGMLPDVTKAVAAGSDAFDRAGNVVLQTGTSVDALAGKLDPLAIAVVQQMKAQHASNQEIIGVLQLLDQYADASDGKRKADEDAAVKDFQLVDAERSKAQQLHDSTQATDDAAEAGDRFAYVSKAVDAAVTGASEATKAAKEALDKYKDSLQETFDASLDAEDAAIGLRQKISELGTEYGEAAKDGEVTRDETDKLTLSVNDAFRAASDYVAKLVESGQVADTPIARQGALRFALEQIAQQAPETRTKVDEYLSKLNEIPTTVATTVDVDTSEAHRKLDEVLAKMTSIVTGGGLGTFFGGSAIPRS